MKIIRTLALSLVSLLPGCVATPEVSKFDSDNWESRVASVGLKSVLRVMSDSGSAGSGFFIHPGGLAVTNAHVVSGSDGGAVQVAVGDAAGSFARYEVLARGESRDLALLRVLVPHPVEALHLGLSAPLELGSRFLAVGGPQGMFPVVTTGVLSGRSRPGFIGATSVPEQLIHSAATLRGSSGCPILSDVGLVVGVQAAKPSMELVKLSEPEGEASESFDRDLQRWSIQTEAFGLAIPIEDLRSFGPGWVAPEWHTGLATGFSCDAHRLGCYITELTPGSPAALSGLEVGDLLVSCNGAPVLSVVDLSVALAGDGSLKLGVLRGEELSVIHVDRVPWAAPPREALSPGLHWRESSGARARLDDGSHREGSISGEAAGARLTSAHLGRDGFSLEYSAWIDVPETGRWVFELASDDGSLLYVRDKLVVDCDGLHAKRAARGEVELQAGLQPIRLLFFEAHGDEVLELRWGILGEELELVSDAAFLHSKGVGW